MYLLQTTVFKTTFTCVVQVAWLRSDSKAILAIHTHMVTNNPRMSVEHNGHNSWTLRLAEVQRNDSGIYMCQINTEPMTSQVRSLLKWNIAQTLFLGPHKPKVVTRSADFGFEVSNHSWIKFQGCRIFNLSKIKPYRTLDTFSNVFEEMGTLVYSLLGREHFPK